MFRARTSYDLFQAQAEHGPSTGTMDRLAVQAVDRWAPLFAFACEHDAVWWFRLEEQPTHIAEWTMSRSKENILVGNSTTMLCSLWPCRFIGQKTINKWTKFLRWPREICSRGRVLIGLTANVLASNSKLFSLAQPKKRPLSPCTWPFMRSWFKSSRFFVFFVHSTYLTSYCLVSIFLLWFRSNWRDLFIILIFLLMHFGLLLHRCLLSAF